MKPGKGGIIGDPAFAPPAPSMCNGELAVPFTIAASMPLSGAPPEDNAVNFLLNTAASDLASSSRLSVCLVASQLSCALFSNERICVLCVASCTSTSFFNDSFWDLRK